MLFPILETICMVLVEKFVNFLQAFYFERNHHGDLYNHKYLIKMRREKVDNTEGGPFKRNWKQGLLSKQIIICNV